MLSLLVLLLAIPLVSSTNIVAYGNDIPFNDSLTVPCTATNLTAVRYIFYESNPTMYTIEFHAASWDDQIITKIDYCDNGSCTYYYNETNIKFCFMLIMKFGNNKISYILDQIPIQISTPPSVNTELGGKIAFGVIGAIVLGSSFSVFAYYLIVKALEKRRQRQRINKPATQAVV